MEIFNIIVGVFSILSFFVSLYAISEVVKIKKKFNVSSTTGNISQNTIGKNNKQAGGSING